MFGSGLMKGLGITARHLWRKPITELYPYDHKALPKTSRTFLAMHVAENGTSSCRACNACVVACPDHVLRITKDPEDNKRPIEFVVNSGRCTFCGLCVESCTFDVLYFTQAYERATADRTTLIYKLVTNGHPTCEGQEAKT